LCIDIPRIIRQVKKEIQCWKSILEKEIRRRQKKNLTVFWGWKANIDMKYDN